MIGFWSEIKQSKTLDREIDSIILHNSKNEEQFIKQINQWCGNKKFELLYRGTRDGTSSQKFIKNVMIKVQLLLYIKIIKVILPEVILLFLGKIIEIIKKVKIVLYLH